MLEIVSQWDLPVMFRDAETHALEKTRLDHII